jgi:hypothetical protein
MSIDRVRVLGQPLTADGAGADLASLIAEHQRHNDVFYSGGPELGEWVHDDEVTLHGGFEISGRGWQVLAQGLTVAANRLSEGRMAFTPLGGRVIGDLAYLAGFEAGTVRLDGGEPRPMALRVTMIHQRVGGRWLAVHRHGEILR